MGAANQIAERQCTGAACGTRIGAAPAGTTATVAEGCVGWHRLVDHYVCELDIAGVRIGQRIHNRVAGRDGRIVVAFGQAQSWGCVDWRTIAI